MFENIINFFKKLTKPNQTEVPTNSKSMAKERLHLVLMQDRANVSADFLELMKQEIIDVIKKYIEVDESAIDVRLTNKTNEDGENGAPALYANIPILNIRNDMKKIDTSVKPEEEKKQNKEEVSEEINKAEEIVNDNREEREEIGEDEEELEEIETDDIDDESDNDQDEDDFEDEESEEEEATQEDNVEQPQEINQE